MIQNISRNSSDNLQNHLLCISVPQILSQCIFSETLGTLNARTFLSAR